jgi:hypothetical protein
MKSFRREVLWMLVPLLAACGEDGKGAVEDTTTTPEPSNGTSQPVGPGDVTPQPGPEVSGPGPVGSQPTPTPSVGPTGGVGPVGPVGPSGAVEPSPSGPTSEPVQAVPSLGKKCERDVRIGAFGVNLGVDRTIVAGAVSTGTTPSSIPNVAAEEGGCQLLTPRNLFCTSCDATQLCAGDEQCVPKPAKVSAGALHITGMAAQVDVSPNVITLDYSKTVLEPFPAYEAGATIRLETDGDVVGAFAADLWGVPAFTTSQTVVAVKRDEPAHLEWDTTGADAEKAAIFVSFSVNVHGAVTGWIECSAPDTGSFDIPASLVTQLVDMGLSGFPRVDIERRSAATVTLPEGCVDTYVSSKIMLDIEVDGLTSCNVSGDCPDGQTCSPEMVCE